MITVTSPTEQILKELNEEESKAIYWMKKQFHGERGYDRMQDELLAKAMDEHKDQKTDTYDYISPRGNRWMAFVYCRYYKDINYAHTVPVAFCYYETYGSVGAFMLYRWQYDQKANHTCAVLFTDHFFLRFCQRLGIEMRSRWMVQRFLEVIPGMTISTSEDLDTQGRVKVDCRLPGSIGRGILRKDGQLMEIRTYLTDKELSRKQLRETKRLREAADSRKIEPWTVKMARMAKADDLGQAITDEIRQIVSMGGDEHTMTCTISMGIWIARALCDLNYADPKDVDFWQRHGSDNADILIDIADYWIKQKKADRRFVALFEKMFRNDGIKKYDIREFIDYLFDMMTADIKQIEDKQ